MASREPPRPTVLVADDDEDLRSALSSFLSDEGYEVLESRDGRDALETLAAAADAGQGGPDVLLLDFCMPGLSGIGLLRVLRRFTRAPPTILITAFPDPSVETFARNAGAIRVLHKPAELQDVAAAVRAALEGDQGRSPSLTQATGTLVSRAGVRRAR
jgi:DNA-binding response OmpR family regulator